MMLDQDIVAVSPKSVYKVLKEAGVLDKKNTKTSKKGGGFTQPEAPHQHWHVDVSYLNICGTFYYLCAVLDGYSRYIVHWDIKESMKEEEIQLIIQKALEKYPESKPRLISDRGPQFTARDFKTFVRLSGMDHVYTSPYYPQSNGKIERWHKELKQKCIRVSVISTLAEAKEKTEKFIEEYNFKRLHSAIGYIAPNDKLLGKEEEIFKQRDHKLALARDHRKEMRKKLKEDEKTTMNEELVGGYVHAGEQTEQLSTTGSLGL